MTQAQRIATTLFLFAAVQIAHAAPVTEARPDRLHAVRTADVRIDGVVGARLRSNLHGILLDKDENALLEPFRTRGPKSGNWTGEHIGKWLSAAAMMTAWSPEPAMQAKIQRVVDGLLATQLDDGYLGTYEMKNHWTSWDVWVHKYNLMGLLDVCELNSLPRSASSPAEPETQARALQACRKMGDLIISTFGPGRRDLNPAGLHAGMAATSILQPMLTLYRNTGDARYLEFAKYILQATEQPNGSKIVSTLLREKTVLTVADAKAYEMISNLIGLLDLYRLTGNEDLLKAVTIATDDILAHRRYITGGCSFTENFRPEGELPNTGAVAETCVTMSLVQLYDSMQRLTGEAKYADAAENLILNHLLACQNPDGKTICYYTPLWGHKFHGNFLGCCISSGPRAIAMIPSLYYYVGNDNRIVVNLLGPSSLHTRLANGQEVTIRQTSNYPLDHTVQIDASPCATGTYRLAIRIPSWSESIQVDVDAKPSNGYLELPIGDKPVTIKLTLSADWRVLTGNGVLNGLFAFQKGPIVYAYDAGDAKGAEISALGFKPSRESITPTAQPAVFNVRAFDRQGKVEVQLRPFMDVGFSNYFSVWLPAAAKGPEKSFSLFTGVEQYFSRTGTHRDSIVDNSFNTYTSTDDGKHKDEDWFEVNAGWNSRYNVIVFGHGRNTATGGWFDTSKGKPRVQLSTWDKYEDVGVLADYPATTAESPGTLKDGQAFRFVIPPDKRTNDFRVRIVGVPAQGNNPAQNSASCSDIQVFYDPNL